VEFGLSFERTLRPAETGEDPGALLEGGAQVTEGTEFRTTIIEEDQSRHVRKVPLSRPFRRERTQRGTVPPVKPQIGVVRTSSQPTGIAIAPE
jgi:hypothetical protein